MSRIVRRRIWERQADAQTTSREDRQTTCHRLLEQRVDGIGGVGVAWAAAPTITSFTPTSGPVGTMVTITGTNFTNPLVNAVRFDSHNAAAFTVVNDTTIMATVPSNGSDGPSGSTTRTVPRR